MSPRPHRGCTEPPISFIIGKFRREVLQVYPRATLREPSRATERVSIRKSFHFAQCFPREKNWGLLKDEGSGGNSPIPQIKLLIHKKSLNHAWISSAVLSLVFFALLVGTAPLTADNSKEPPQIPPGAKLLESDRSVFRPDPTYGDKPYDAKKQLDIYGAKYANPTARPLLELGRELYTSGPFRPAINAVGKKNLLIPHLHVYGDYRAAIAYNDNGKKEKWTLANRLNLDIDFKLTATERVHAFMRPLDKNGNFTRFDFGGGNEKELKVQLDGNADALFFEGDLGPILEGITDRHNNIDLPFAVGLMPLLFQNGIWVEDAFTGAAFTIPARNSALLDISNMDITFFAGFDKVTSRAVVKQNGDLVDDRHNRIYGAAAFIEANQGYWEIGYGYTDPKDDGNNPLDDLSYNSLTASFTRRYWGLLSNSVRTIWSFGQNRDTGLNRTADGFLLLIENSLITPKPLTLVPYLNLFIGNDKPQSLARDAGAGGVLKNTGILFETDGLTGFPKMDDTGNDTMGGALGLEYLFNLNQQIVFETAIVNDIGRDSVTKGDQFGVGVRYQIPITNAFIFRADLTSAFLKNDEDLFGVRFEIRRKF